MNRRTVLGTIGAGASGLLAGCSGPLPYVGTVVLNGLYITNAEDESHEVRVVVETADETHLDRVVEVDDGTTLRCTWPEEAAQYMVRARHDGEWVELEFPADADENCHIVEFAIGGHPGNRDRFEPVVHPCRPKNLTRCGYDGHGTPEDRPPRQ